MDIQAEKIELVKMLLNTEDEAIIKQVRALFKPNEKDFWDTLPEHVKAGVKKSRRQADEGQLISFDEIIGEMKKF